jgi:hypothetical protein
MSIEPPTKQSVWTEQPSGRGDRRCHVVACREEGRVFVGAVARQALYAGKPRATKSGYGRQLGSRQHKYCNAHAEQLFSELRALVDDFGGGA